MKKNYFIIISGESAGYTEKSLTDAEYELISDIFEECDSEYVGGSIYEVPDINALYNKLGLDKMSEWSYMDVHKLVYDEFGYNLNPSYIDCIIWKLREKFMK